ncbi:MAG: sugar phosphate isomerase/epimerase family protein [Christensenellales bacterium]|jgi:sugar phosphate isomerase/epimerase
MRLGFSISPKTMHRAEEFKAAGVGEAEIGLHEYRESIELALEMGGKVYDAATAAGLGIWSTHLPSGDLWEIDTLDEEQRKRNVQNLTFVMRTAAGWDSKILVVHGLGANYREGFEQQCIDACCRSLDEMSTFASRYGMMVAVENIPRTPLECSWAMLKLMDSCAGLCFDTNHLLLQGHEEFLDDMEKYVITVHLSDYDRGGPLGERHWKPGEKGGIVPWEMVCSRLIRTGYRGPWMLETNIVDYSYTVREVVTDFLTCSRLG